MADTNVDGVYGIGKSGGMQTEPRASAGGRMLNRKGGEEVVNPARDTSIGGASQQPVPAVEVEKTSRK
jgi:hypothetical protein